MWFFLPFERTKFKVHEKAHELLQQVSRKISCSSWPLREHPPWQVRLPASRAAREIWHSRHRPMRKIARLLSLGTGLWALSGLDFNHTARRHSYTSELRQTGILANPETRLTQPSLKQDRTVHNRSRYKYRAQNTRVQFCAIASKIVQKSPSLCRQAVRTL